MAAGHAQEVKTFNNQFRNFQKRKKRAEHIAQAGVRKHQKGITFSGISGGGKREEI